MIEQICSITAAAVVLVCTLLRINELYLERNPCTVWRVLEVAGLAVIMGGSVGISAEWFLPKVDGLHMETVFTVGAALFALGVTRTVKEAATAEELEAWAQRVTRDITELAALAERPEEFQQVRAHARAILARTGSRIRAIADPAPAAPGAADLDQLGHEG